MPDLNLTDANSNPDPYLAACYPNVEQGTNKGVILEIRRERTIELVMEGLRQWDYSVGKKVNKCSIITYLTTVFMFPE